MKRRTIICLFKDDNKKEYCIRNRNTDFFGDYFCKLLELIPNDEDISLVQESLIMNKWFKNKSFEIISILDAANHYNRDQKAINDFKNEYSKKMELSGYKWNDALDEFFKADYNDTDENKKLINEFTNFRNLSTLYEEKIAELNKKFAKEEAEYVEKHNELVKKYEIDIMYLNSIKDDVIKNTNKNNELNNANDELEIEIVSNKNKLDELQKKLENLEVSNKERLDEAEKIYNSRIDLYKSTIDSIKEESTQKNNEYQSIIESKKAEINELDNKLDIIKNEIAKYDSINTEQINYIKFKTDLEMARNLIYDLFGTYDYWKIRDKYKNTNLKYE